MTSIHLLARKSPVSYRFKAQVERNSWILTPCLALVAVQFDDSGLPGRTVGG